MYEVRYSIDANGLRRTVGDGNRLAVFLGCSFTFGEGVADDMTLPQRFAGDSGWRAYNFGVPGYGAHQVLRLLEIDRPQQVAGRKPDVVVYTMLPTHASRAAGRSFWESHGPHYEVVDGVAKYLGSYQEVRLLPAAVDRVFGRSRLYRNLVDMPLRLHVWPRDRERLLHIVSRARDLTADRYGARFVVLAWDHPGERSEINWLADRLRARGIEVVRVSELAPGMFDDDTSYIPIDGHPSGAAYARVAKQLARYLE